MVVVGVLGGGGGGLPPDTKSFINSPKTLSKCKFFLKVIERDFISKWTILISTIFCILGKQECSGIFLMCVLLYFLIIPSTPIITRIIVVFKCHILICGVFI